MNQETIKEVIRKLEKDDNWKLKEIKVRVEELLEFVESLEI